jgi:uncharacterized protein (TIGR02186 family)
MARPLQITAPILLCLLIATAAGSEQAAGVTVSPDRIRIGLTYAGQEISIRAAVPDGADLAVRILGAGGDLHLKKKGRKAGILWMNVGEVVYHDIPSLLIVRSSRPLEALASVKSLEEFGLGYEALEARAVDEHDASAHRNFGEMLRLKEKEKLFSASHGGIRLSPLGQGFQEASTSFFLPPKAPPGKYTVDLFSFRNGQGTLIGSGSFSVEFSPSTQFLSQMARDHGLLYGCLAAVIAIFAGLATGFIFGGKGEGH